MVNAVFQFVKNKNIRKLLRVFFIVVGVFGLISIRMVEQKLFYDPFLPYFHEANKDAVFPDFLWMKMIFFYLFRFALNVLFSAMIVHFIFQSKKWTLQAIILMIIVFAITFPIYLFCIKTNFEIGYLFSFYMRRFVIQPIILLLIIPMFYYRKKILEQPN